MPIAILTYDLHGAAPELRQRLERDLLEKNYKRVFKNGAFAKTYAEAACVEGVVSGIKNDFHDVAVAAGAGRYTLKIFTARR